MIAGGRPSSFFLSSMFPFFPLLKLFSISCTCATNEMYLYPPISGCSFSSLAFLPHRPLSTRLSLLSDDDATHTSPIGSSAPPSATHALRLAFPHTPFFDSRSLLPTHIWKIIFQRFSRDTAFIFPVHTYLLCPSHLIFSSTVATLVHTYHCLNASLPRQLSLQPQPTSC